MELTRGRIYLYSPDGISLEEGKYGAPCTVFVSERVRYLEETAPGWCKVQTLKGEIITVNSKYLFQTLDRYESHDRRDNHYRR